MLAETHTISYLERNEMYEVIDISFPQWKIDF